ncbi:MAG: Rrf2 family nitric oxide-sensitive transcriptional repressor [Verrucomicrobiales bacterium]|jgi:Rrf2 family nitric oxide-sensitive transcriptional repressor
MISQTAEYALRAIVFLGNEKGIPQTTSKISSATKAPSSYLSKVMQRLSQQGIVGSQRGLHGGFTIKKPLTELTILDVVNAVDPILRIHECPLGNKAHGKNLCALHRTMDDTLAQAEESFRKITVDSLLEQPKLKKTCRFPCKTRGTCCPTPS